VGYRKKKDGWQQHFVNPLYQAGFCDYISYFNRIKKFLCFSKLKVLNKWACATNKITLSEIKLHCLWLRWTKNFTEIKLSGNALKKIAPLEKIITINEHRKIPIFLDIADDNFPNFKSIRQYYLWNTRIWSVFVAVALSDCFRNLKVFLWGVNYEKRNYLQCEKSSS